MLAQVAGLFQSIARSKRLKRETRHPLELVRATKQKSQLNAGFYSYYQ